MEFELSLNFEGNDYTVRVADIETANLILNDPAAASKYLLENYPQFLPGHSAGPVNRNTVVTSTPSATVEQSETELSADYMDVEADMLDTESIIWVNRKPNAKDLEATQMLLQLRQKMETEFSDKKTSKSRLWQKIGETLIKGNYKMGENAAERCRQKFANLTKAYLKYIKHQKTTGEGNSLEPPPFFEELHSLLSPKHKVNPVHLEDSMNANTKGILESHQPTENINDMENENANITDTLIQENVGQNSEENIENRFSKSRKSVKPHSKTDAVLLEMEKANAARDAQFQTFLQHLKKTEDQTDRFLNILEKAFSSKGRDVDNTSNDN